MNRKQLLSLLTVLLLLAAMLAGCGAKSTDNMVAAPEAAPEMAYPEEAPIDTELTDSSQSSEVSLPENQKLITTIHLNAETEDLDATLSYVDSKIAALGGYIESQDIYNGSAYSSYRYRSANITVRIPADNLDQFVNHVSESANIVSRNTSTENVTLTYISVQSRITALETEEARLLELMAKAENMEDLLTIQGRLTDVRTELEQYASQLRLLDNKIDYGTIYLNLEEVKEYTEVEEEPETFWDRISTGFVKSLKNLWSGIKEITIFFIIIIPYLLPFALIAAVIILICKLANRKKAKKTIAPPNFPEEKKE